MRALILHTWLGNLGNRFVQKGAVATVRRAFPDAEVLEVDGFPNYRSDLYNPGRGETRSARLRDLFSRSYQDRKNARRNSLSLLDLVDADVAVLPGCTLYEPALSDYRDTLAVLDDRDIPVIFLGAGGGNYERETRDYVTSIFEEHQPAALLTRDKSAYQAYRDTVSYAYEGIDCAFFIDDWFDPPAADVEYVAATFDKREEPPIDRDCMVVRPSHYHPAYGGKALGEHFEKTNAFVSDTPEELLFLYASVKETHTDRVHACLPTLMYGNEARLYLDSPRTELFEGLVDGSLNDELASIDRERVDTEKESQVRALRDAIEDVV